MKKLLKITACTLVGSLLLQMLPTGISSAQTATDAGKLSGAKTATEALSSAPSQSTTKPQIVGEVTEKRNANSKTFKLSDGTYEIAQYQYPVHYKDGTGKWQNIDNNLTEKVDNTVSDDVTSDTDSASPSSAASDGSSSASSALSSICSDASQSSLATENGAHSSSTASTSSFVSSGKTSSGSISSAASAVSRIVSALTSGEPSSSCASQANSSPASSASSGINNNRGDTTDIFGPVRKIADDIKDGYQNVGNSFQVKFAKGANSSALVRVKDGTYQLSWGISETGLNRNSAYNPENAATNLQAKTSGMTSNESQFTKLQDLGSGCVYNDVLPNVDLQYNLISQNLKEYLLLKNAQAQTDFDFTYRLKNLEMRAKDDGSIEVYDPAKNTVQYTIPKPVMMDASGVASNKVSIAFQKVGAYYQIHLSADKSWVDDSTRKFPVTIDPDLQTSLDKTKIHDTFVASGSNSANTNFTSYGMTLVGHETSTYGITRSYYKFDLPSLSPSSKITDAEFSLYEYNASPSGFSNDQINVHEVTSGLDTASVTWNSQPSYNPVIGDYLMADSSANWRTWNITKMVNDWYTTGNNGLVVKANDENAAQVAYFYSSDYPNLSSSAYPNVVFHYVDTTGLEDYWSTHSQDAGRAGTGYMNDFTGNVTLVENDVTESGSKAPLTINHVFNNTSAVDGSYASQAVKYGNGWRLDVGERVYACSIPNYPYYLVDGDGTKHYFYQDTNNASAGIVDEDGLGLTLTNINENAGAVTIQIKSKDGTVKKYDYLGHIYQEIDASGNTIQYNYGPIPNVDNYLTSISDGSGRTTTLQYNSNHVLTGITDSSGRQTTFGYDDPNSGAHLTSITYPDGKIVYYSYNGDKIASMTNIDGYKITYSSYDGQNRCTGITETGVDGTAGSAMSIQYPSYNTTKFTDTIKNRSETYQFDNNGRTVDIVDDNQSASMYSYASTNAGATKQQNHKITSEAQATQPVYNLIDNPGFEFSGDIWSNGDLGSLTPGADYGVGRQSSGGYKSSNCILVTKTNPASTAGVVQDATGLGQGTYTLSTYVKTSNVSANGADSGAGAVVAIYRSGVLNRTLKSQLITGTTDTSVNDGWQRVSVTFDVQSGDTQIRLFGAITNTTGSACFDNFQLETGPVANLYNMIDNSSLETNASSGATPYRWNSSFSAGDGLQPVGKNGTWAVQINGNNSRKYVNQSVAVSGKEGDDFILSGWAKADSVAITGAREFRLCAAVIYTDGSVQWRGVPFNTSVSDWQYTSGVISTTYDDTASDPNHDKTLSRIDVYAFYSYNANTALFDGIQLYQDNGESYSYDSNGNLVSNKDQAAQNSAFNYNSNNDLIKATDPNGSSFNYTYDSSHRVTKATNQSDTAYSFQYDTSGNPTGSAAEGRQPVTSVQNGGIYYIRASESRQYLDVQGIVDANGTPLMQNPFNGGLNQQFRLIDAGNGSFKIQPMNCASGRVVDVNACSPADGTKVQIWDSYGNSAQTYKISSNGDGTFSILTACSNYSSALDTQNDTLNTLVVENHLNGSATQRFVFEAVPSTPKLVSGVNSLVSGKDYYIRSGLNNLYLDESGNTPQSNLIQNAYSGASGQKWRAVDKGNGYFKFVNETSGLCIDIPGAQNVDSLPVQVYTDLNNINQEFRPVNTGDGTFEILTHASSDSKGLDDAGAQAASGSAVHQFTYNGTANQKWVFEDASQPTQSTAPATSVTSGQKYYLRSDHSGLFMSAQSGGTAPFTTVDQENFTGSTSQMWTIIDIGGGYDNLICNNSNLALDVPNGSDSNSLTMQLYSQNGLPPQQYKLSNNGDGTFAVLTRVSCNDSPQKCLDVDMNGVDSSGTRINQFDYHGNWNQKWILYPVNNTTDKIQNTSTYTADGNYMSSVTDTRGNTVTYDYNHDANGNALSSNEYNKGLLRSTTDAKGNKTSYTYDANTDDITSAKSTADGQTVSNAYGYSNDKLTSITHNGFTYSFGYDSFGNSKSISVGSQNLLTNNYEGNNGNLLSTTYGNGQTVGYAYDYYDRVTSRSYNGATRYGWTYDAKGNIGVYTDNVNGNSYRYTYDFADRPFRIDGSNGHTVQYSYDKNSSVNRLVQSLGSSTFSTTYAYNGDNLLSRLTMGTGDNLYFTYDGLNRLAGKQFTFGNNKLTTGYTYLAGANGNTSTLVSGYAITKNAGGTDTSLHNYGYAYDQNGNITTISENGAQKAAYQYNELNELKREDNAYLNKSIVYAYDAGGNLLSKTEYPYTTGTLGTATATHTYTYGDGNWKDKLTAYDGNPITYDAIGNPLNYYNGWNFGWEEGNQLASAQNGSNNISYKYNSDGIRTQKTVNGVTTTYYLEDGNVTWEQSGSDTIHYVYDSDGDLVYMVLNGALYYYERNAQNDIIGLVDSNLNEVVTYTYDSWGKLLNIGGSLASTVGQKNPYRYRGYRYDNETGLYYLQSRYYDPNTGRFINADDTDVLNNTDKNLLSVNLFAYCENNPVNKIDDDGHLAWLLAGAAFLIPGVGEVLMAVAVVALVVVAAAVLVTAVSYGVHQYQSNVYLAKRSKSQSDPFARPNQKKQGREKKEKKKDDDKKWKGNSNKRQKPLPKHTPGNDHRKYKP